MLQLKNKEVVPKLTDYQNHLKQFLKIHISHSGVTLNSPSEYSKNHPGLNITLYSQWGTLEEFHVKTFKLSHFCLHHHFYKTKKPAL